MMGVPKREPNTPPLDIVKVPIVVTITIMNTILNMKTADKVPPDMSSSDMVPSLAFLL